MPSIINATTTNGVAISPDNSGSLQLATNNGTTAVTIDTSQNVGIGTTSPASYNSFANQLVVGGSGDKGLTIASGTSNYGSIHFADGTSGADSYRGQIVYYHANNYMSFSTDATERMRIDSSGNVLVNTTGTGAYTDGKIVAIASGTSPALTVKNLSSSQFVASFWNNGTSGDNIIQQFITETSPTVRGSITYNRGGGLIAYNTTSDYRLKENIVDLPNALQTVSQLKPRQFDWKENGNTTTGFIAHELAEVCPHAVNGEKDAVDAEGKPVYQGVDTSFLVATLTAAIQEQQAQIEQLKAEVQALKGTA